MASLGANLLLLHLGGQNVGSDVGIVGKVSHARPSAAQADISSSYLSDSIMV
jgi:hypothetical protein